jgi:hypothetical protein
MQTLWTVGYVIGEIPSNMILTRVRPSIWIPCLEVIWTVLTFCTSRCNTAVCRSLLGRISGKWFLSRHAIPDWFLVS